MCSDLCGARSRHASENAYETRGSLTGFREVRGTLELSQGRRLGEPVYLR